MLARLPVEFLGSFPDPLHPLEPAGPEIALLGRSNVGKSSLLNALLGRRVAKVSATPGKTQYLNAFRVGPGYLVDLPGYGWSRTSQSERGRFRRLVGEVIAKRRSLAGVIWLLDIRHPPSRDDFAMQELLEESRHPVLVVLTKGDKLTGAGRRKAEQARAAELGVPLEQLLATSSRSGDGIATLAESVQALLEP